MLYLHGSNPVILHRDLKSDNLLVASDWTIKVADFGLTRFLSNGKKAMTQVGTPMWMAPEIIMGKKYTEKADVYAFGIILWEIMTRCEPYDDKEPMQIVVEVVNDNLRPKMLPEFEGDALIPLMKDSWVTNPDERPSFKEIVERLEILLDKELVKEKQERASSRRGNSLSGVSGSAAPGALAITGGANGTAANHEDDPDEPLTPRSIAARAAGGDPSAGPEKRSHRLSARLAAVSSTQTQFSPRSSTRSTRSNSRGSYDSNASGTWGTDQPMLIHGNLPSGGGGGSGGAGGGAGSSSLQQQQSAGGGGGGGGGGGSNNSSGSPSPSRNQPPSSSSSRPSAALPSTVHEEDEDDV